MCILWTCNLVFDTRSLFFFLVGRETGGNRGTSIDAFRCLRNAKMCVKMWPSWCLVLQLFQLRKSILVVIDGIVIKYYSAASCFLIE
jgi:hypothetical protein